MSHTAFSKWTAFARRYPRRQGKKDNYAFRATNSESSIAFIPETPAKTGVPDTSGRWSEATGRMKRSHWKT